MRALKTEEAIIVNALAREMGTAVSSAGAFRRLYLLALVEEQPLLVPLSVAPARGRSTAVRAAVFEDGDHALFERSGLITLVGRPWRAGDKTLHPVRLTDQGRELALRFLEAERRAKAVHGVDFAARSAR